MINTFDKLQVLQQAHKFALKIKEFIQFLYQAKGSLAETQYHLMLAKDLNIIKELEFASLIAESDEIGKMISGLIKYLKNNL